MLKKWFMNISAILLKLKQQYARGIQWNVFIRSSILSIATDKPYGFAPNFPIIHFNRSVYWMKYNHIALEYNIHRVNVLMCWWFIVCFQQISINCRNSIFFHLWNQTMKLEVINLCEKIDFNLVRKLTKTHHHNESYQFSLMWEKSSVLDLSNRKVLAFVFVGSEIIWKNIFTMRNNFISNAISLLRYNTQIKTKRTFLNYRKLCSNNQTESNKIFE